MHAQGGETLGRRRRRLAECESLGRKESVAARCRAGVVYCSLGQGEGPPGGIVLNQAQRGPLTGSGTRPKCGWGETGGQAGTTCDSGTLEPAQQGRRLGGRSLGRGEAPAGCGWPTITHSPPPKTGLEPNLHRPLPPWRRK